MNHERQTTNHQLTPYVIGTAGHVDHGKSLLVEALTGIDPDRLAEEKQRGMTIDLGFAWLTLPGGRTVSIVDVPGHERFIRNMLAGAGGIDLALLVVAADDGVMPQTREHLAILDLLAVTRGVVALTKCDLADDEWTALVTNDITELLSGTALAGSPIVQCSAVTRTGLDDLTRVLDEAIAALPPKRDVARPRLPIDRVFTIGGFGTVVTGTLVDGHLDTGVEIEVVPGQKRGRIRGLQSHRDAVERAAPGMRTAVNVTGMAKHDLRRGLVLACPGTLHPTDVIDARVRAVAGLRRALRHNARLTMHVFADEVEVQLRLLDSDELRPGESAWAQLKLSASVGAARGDRFVLRTPDDTVAGGVIATTAPKRHRRHDPALIARLEAMLSNAPEDIVLETIARRSMPTIAELTSEVAGNAPDLPAVIRALEKDGAIRILPGDHLITTGEFERLSASAHSILAAYHRDHPLRTGIPQEELRSRLRLEPASFTATLTALPNVTIDTATVRQAGFSPAPDAAAQAQIDAWLARLRASPASPPLDARPAAALIAYLVETNAIIDAGDGVIFDAESFSRMTAAARAHIEQHGSITIAEARDLLGTSRRYAQALLEHLDRTRVTRREGDAHVLR